MEVGGFLHLSLRQKGDDKSPTSVCVYTIYIYMYMVVWNARAGNIRIPQSWNPALTAPDIAGPGCLITTLRSRNVVSFPKITFRQCYLWALTTSPYRTNETTNELNARLFLSKTKKPPSILNCRSAARMICRLLDMWYYYFSHFHCIHVILFYWNYYLHSEHFSEQTTLLCFCTNYAMVTRA